ncbi:hypothetical protein [Kitasatospora sp. NPDC057223]|uniref:hypothetical protein n=1 Tax=Kitasatospora sp. NPDC057223 TaxID=3346055 RepID=UPI00364016C6
MSTPSPHEALDDARHVEVRKDSIASTTVNEHDGGIRNGPRRRRTPAGTAAEPSGGPDTGFHVSSMQKPA